jgi:hypothetical protein
VRERERERAREEDEEYQYELSGERTHLFVNNPIELLYLYT